VFVLDPCELNIIIAGIVNFLYTSLTEEEFAALNILLAELSKSMFSMYAFEDIDRKKNKKFEK